jgi:hypothetical protein
MDKFKQGNKLQLNFADATRFWGITGYAIDYHLALVRQTLQEAEIDGIRVSADDIQQLLELNEFLLNRFGRHLTLLRQRNSSTH